MGQMSEQIELEFPESNRMDNGEKYIKDKNVCVNFLKIRPFFVYTFFEN